MDFTYKNQYIQKYKIVINYLTPYEIVENFFLILKDFTYKN